jgi:hypothetical protein
MNFTSDGRRKLTFPRNHLEHSGFIHPAPMKIILAVLLTLLPLILHGQSDGDLLRNLKPHHPRLLVTDTTWQDLQTQRKQSPVLDRLLKKMEADGRTLLTEPPLTYKKTGVRLLAVSREAFHRIVLWSFDYRITKDEVFKARAEQEMLAMAAFNDWNPTHFLDVAEMTAGMSLGYDWLYDTLSPECQATIRQAIIDKGLKAGDDPALPGIGWYKMAINWNQVCFGGLTLGALAVADAEPGIASKMLREVRANNPNGMTEYVPKGVYPEGPSYWNYGTTYEVILISALESALGTDWGISESPGFLSTAEYPLETTGPTGLAFNYSDGAEKVKIEPPLFWFARKLQRPDILYYQHALLQGYLDNLNPPKAGSNSDGFLPVLTIWASPGDLDNQNPPSRPLAWLGVGPNPLAIFRSSWSDPDALFLAVKGGSASLNHGHMDAGAFVLDADGVRWARMLGSQDYYSLESKGVKLWDFAQDGGRWTVFRLNNLSQSTLTINGKPHDVAGNAPIIRFSGDSAKPHAVIDLSPVFAGQAQKVVRGFKLLPNRRVLIRDEISGLQPGDEVRWAFVTGATVILNGRHATLQQQGKSLQIALATPADGKFEVIPADPPADGFNAPNPGVSILIAKLHPSQAGKLLIQVLIQPGEAPLPDQTLKLHPCESWSAALPLK